MNDKPSRNPPLPVKRAVRQRCGFGCVICGLPLCEYEHMEGWAVVKEHVEKDITLLCNRHHTERTKGLLPIEQVREADRNPYNLREGVSPPYTLHYSGTTAIAILGSNVFRSAPLENGRSFLIPIMVDLEPLVLFRLEDGHLLLTLQVFDIYNKQVLRIVDNELVFSATGIWDIEFVKTRLTIRDGFRKIRLQVSLNAPSGIIIERGLFLRNGVQIEIHSDGRLTLNAKGFELSESYLDGLNAGIVIGEAIPGLNPLYGNPYVSRYSHAPMEQ